MKLFLSLSLLLLNLSWTAQAEEYEIDFAGERWIIAGEAREVSEEFSLQNVNIRFLGSDQRFLIDAAPGWGAAIFDTICNQITNSLYPYAESYDQLEATGFFTPNDFVIFKANGNPENISYELANKDRVSVYYKNLLCTKTNYEY